MDLRRGGISCKNTLAERRSRGKLESLSHCSLQAWGVEPSSLLMVGDSFEDVEVGNAAGTATCLVAGGGNEKPGVVVVTPAGAVATFVVPGLPQLREMLQAGASAGLQLGWPAREAAGEAPADEGAPAPGLDFLDWCVGVGALSNGGASFPRMGRYAGGLATSDVQGKLTNC